MEERMRNLVALLFVIVILAGAVYFFTSSTPESNINNNLNNNNTGNLDSLESFQSEFSQLTKVWLASGVKSTTLHSATDELKVLDNSTLTSLKSQIDSFASSARTQQARKISQVYSVLLEKVIQDKKSDIVLASLEDVEDGCASIGQFRSLSEEMGKSLELSKTYLTEVNSFVQSYPEEADFIEIYSNTTYPEEATLSKQEIEESVALLEEVCG